MSSTNVSRRRFLTGSAVGAAAWATPGAANALQASGVKADDLTIKEVKVYVLKAKPGQSVGGSTQQLASVVTNSGIEGNYTLATRYFHPNWSNLGWLEYAKPC